MDDSKSLFEFGLGDKRYRVRWPEWPEFSMPRVSGLLDDSEDSEDDTPRTALYDDPVRMGLLRAGLGLLSAPRYSTNPNDVGLGAALSAGLGGYLQGYGNTTKRVRDQQQKEKEAEAKRNQQKFENRLLEQRTNADTFYKNRLSAQVDSQSAQRRREREEEGRRRRTMIQEMLESQPTKTDQVRLRNRLQSLDTETLTNQYRRMFPSPEQQAQQQQLQNLRARLAEKTGGNADDYASYDKDDLVKAISQWEQPQEPSRPTEADERMIDALNRGESGKISLDSPEYMNAYSRYYEKYLRPETYNDGTTYIPDSQFTAPPNFKALNQAEQKGLVSEIEVQSGRLIKPMPQEDKEKVRDLLADLQQLEEYESVLRDIDIDPAKKITQNSPQLASLKTLFKDLQLRIKDSRYGLGALQGADLDLLNAIITDPTEGDLSNVRAFLKDKGYYLAQANQLKRRLVSEANGIYNSYDTSTGEQYQKRYGTSLNWFKPESTPNPQVHPETGAVLRGDSPSPAPAPAPAPTPASEDRSWWERNVGQPLEEGWEFFGDRFNNLNR